MMWHDIDKATRIYKIAFGIDIDALLSGKKSALEKAVELRHDCIHRNGYDKDNNQLDNFTKEYVEETGAIIDDLVLEIEGKFDLPFGKL